MHPVSGVQRGLNLGSRVARGHQTDFPGLLPLDCGVVIIIISVGGVDLGNAAFPQYKQKTTPRKAPVMGAGAKEGNVLAPGGGSSGVVPRPPGGALTPSLMPRGGSLVRARR